MLKQDLVIMVFIVVGLGGLVSGFLLGMAFAFHLDMRTWHWHRRKPKILNIKKAGSGT